MLRKTEIAVIPYDNVIAELKIQKLCTFSYTVCNADVVGAGRRVTAGVIVKKNDQRSVPLKRGS
jgi:hypothetical protein